MKRLEGERREEGERERRLRSSASQLRLGGYTLLEFSTRHRERRRERRARVSAARTHLNPWRLYPDPAVAWRSDQPVQARRSRVWRRERPARAASRSIHQFSAEPLARCGHFDDDRALESDFLQLMKRPFAASQIHGRPTPPSGLTGCAMGDFGEGPLGTKLGQGATAVKYPRPTRVKNKTPAPTQVRPRAAARRAFSSRLVEISPPSSARVFPASESFLPLSTLADPSSSPPPPFSHHLAVRVHRSPRSRSCARRRSTRRRISRRPR